MRYLVVGASGYLGSTVSAEARARGHTVVGTGNATTPGQVHAAVSFDFWADDLVVLLDQYDPDVVVFAARVERDQPVRFTDGDFAVAASRVARACARTGTRLVYVSSDAVFDGTGGRYPETGTRSPVSRYARRLVVFEEAVQEHCADYVLVRPSILYGFAPTGLDDRLRTARERLGGSRWYLRYTNVYRSPVEVGEASEGICDLAESEFVGVVHLGGPRRSYYDFHREALDTLGVETEMLAGQPATGDCPQDRSLDSSRFAKLVGWWPSSPGVALLTASQAQFLDIDNTATAD
ncbi:sugar nucleotide-binding protein [Haloarchaeobius sp. DT45]|uniref:sugar nucleotide-binding protein n=1 Tax=Haloarchaeobius sp. DT45 TaxID=3446116 RepID=UPI003F6AB4A6